MTQEHLVISNDWTYRSLTDAGGVLYHPYGGDVQAVTELPAQLLRYLAGGQLTREECIAATILSFPDEVEAELREAVHSHLNSLIELGAISTLTTSANS